MGGALDDVVKASAVEQARAVRDGHVSSRELVATYLARIERSNAAVAAFVEVFAKRAILEATVKDAARLTRSRGALPPFHGVPVGIKDLNFVRGARVGFGSRGLSVWSPVDDRTTARLRDAGFVVLGKLATSELGVMPVTEPDTHPPTRNPWDPRATAGGSSGGSGAAVAAGLLPIAHGSDGAGSIRIPASLCHLVGLKPSRGRVRNAFGFPDDAILYTCGPIARTVLDAAAMLDVMAGITVGTPYVLAPPPAPFASLLDEAPRGLRVRLVLENPSSALDPEVREVVLAAAKALEALGHRVDEAPPFEGDLDEFLPVYQKLVSSPPAVRWSRVQPVTRWLGKAGKRLSSGEVLARQRRMAARAERWLEGCDVVLSPTVPVLAPRVGAFERADPEATFRAAAILGVYTAIFNVTGGAAVSVPLGVSRCGLPIGVQIGARCGDDLRVLQVARQLEQSMPWAHRRAPLFDEAHARR
jgi:amidase